MKLLYLYIEDYHRVHRERGINFDSNYRFEFDGRTLTGSRHHVLPKKFFSIREKGCDAGRVEAVSAIIGANGTGKTSVMSFINEIFAGGRNRQDLRFIYVLRGKFDGGSHNTYRCYDNLPVGIECDIPSRWRSRWKRIHIAEDEMLPEPPVKVIYFSPFYTTQEVLVNKGDAFIDISTTGLMRRDENSSDPLGGFERDERERVLNIIKRLGRHPDAFSSTAPMPSPDEIEVAPNLDLIQSVSRNFTRNVNRKDQSREERERDHLFEDSLDIGMIPDPLFRLCAAYIASMGMWISVGEKVSARHTGYFEFLADVSVEMRDLMHKESYQVGRNSYPKTEKPLRHWERLSGTVKQKLRRHLVRRMASYELPVEQDPPLPGSVDAHEAFVRLLDCAEQLAMTDEKGRSDGVLRIGIRDHRQQELLYKFLGNYDQIQRGGLVDRKTDFMRVKYGRMSSGEMAYLSLLSRLDEFCSARPKDGRLGDCRDLIVFLDEAETTLHPEWQRQLVYNVIWYFENFTRNFRVHVIFASHSPMLLSDIPYGNVCFLDPKESDVVRSDYLADVGRLHNTFGANVYDLYRLSFGLSHGVFGCLADLKLKMLKNRLEVGGRFSDDDRKTVDLIGDDLIRGCLKRAGA